MTRQSLDAFRRTITVEWPRAIQADAKALLIRTARDGNRQIVAEQTARAGVPPRVTAYANSPGNPVLESVRLPGPIVYRYDYRAEIATVALAALRAASPVQSGRYRDAHTLLLNGKQIDTVPATLSDADEIAIVNPLPYARRIEVGKTKSGRDFVIRVPNRIYERVAKTKLAPVYRNVATVRFGYLELSGAHSIRGGLSPFYLTGATRKRATRLGGVGSPKRRIRRQQIGQAVRAPAIFIRATQIRAV